MAGSRRPRVVVLDYGSGNLRSAVRALERVGAEVALTSDADAAARADGLLVPGVGAFGACMRGLRAVGGEKLIETRLLRGAPVLGICVGMQVLFERGVEHASADVAPDREPDNTGCGQWPGVVERLRAHPLPHMGWNTVEVPAGTKLLAGVENERFYFVHSFAVRQWLLPSPGQHAGPLAPPLVTWAEHGGDRFVAAVENGPLSATQFHPEKSGDAGAIVLRNWLETL